MHNSYRFWGAAAVVAALSVAGCGGSNASGGSAKPAKPVTVSNAELAKLPRATTYAKLSGAASDPEPNGAGDGTVTHPNKEQIVYSRPGGRAIAVLPTAELKSPTWVPIVAKKPGGWEQVLLPSRPNHASGWIYTKRGGLRTAHTSYLTRIKLAKHQLAVSKHGHSLGSWKVGIGTPKTPTPKGRTFLLASLAPAHPSYSPLILPLGTHSNSLDKFGGGPGTVALHGWPNSKVFGRSISHGCVRVPSRALKVLSNMPLGSPVVIS